MTNDAGLALRKLVALATIRAAAVLTALAGALRDGE